MYLNIICDYGSLVEVVERAIAHRVCLLLRRRRPINHCFEKINLEFRISSRLFPRVCCLIMENVLWLHYLNRILLIVIVRTIQCQICLTCF